MKHQGLWLAAALVALWGVHHMPFPGLVFYPVMLFDTLVHEMGHGLTALLLGGRIDKLELFTDGSGLAYNSGISEHWKHAAVAAGGLLGPPIASSFAFFAGRRARTARAWLAGMGLFLSASLLVFVRGGFAWPFLLAPAAVFFLLAIKAKDWMARLVTLMLACELAILTYSRSDYLFVAFADVNGGHYPSDVQIIAQNLGMPYWFWGAIIGGLSALVVLLELRSYVRHTRPIEY